MEKFTKDSISQNFFHYFKINNSYPNQNLCLPFYSAFENVVLAFCQL